MDKMLSETKFRSAEKLNKEWHLKNKMPKKPTLEDRINWHIEHAKHCFCREMPDSIKKEIARRKKESVK